MPTCPGPAPFCQSDGSEIEAYRARALALTCLAGLAGLPQITLPLARIDAFVEAEEKGGGDDEVDGDDVDDKNKNNNNNNKRMEKQLIPVGLSLVGPRGSDLELLRAATRLSKAMAESRKE